MIETAAPRRGLRQTLLVILLCLSMTVPLYTAQAFFNSEEAYGANILVTSPADNNIESGTLRKAIEAVTATDTDIYFDFGTSDTTIYLNSALESTSKSFTIRNRGTGTVTVVAAQGDPVFSLKGGDISISGCTLVGNGTEPVITVVDDQVATPTDLTLGGVDPSAAVTITGGGDSGVKFEGKGTLTLAGNVLITNNSSSTLGGGIFVSEATLAITGSSAIQGNTAPNGQDIYYAPNQSISLGNLDEFSKIVVGSVYTGAEPNASGQGTVPFVLNGWLSDDSSIGVESFATAPPLGSVLVSSNGTTLLRTGNPTSFSFTGLGAGHWAQAVGTISGNNPVITSIVVSDAPAVTSTDIDLNNIQPLVLTFSHVLSSAESPTNLYVRYLPLGKGFGISPESAPGADDGFVYLPSAGTITISAKLLSEYIAYAQSKLGADPLGACKMEIQVEGSNNAFSLFYADFTIVRNSSPTPTPTPTPPIPPTSDTTDLALPFACLFAGLTLCAASLVLRRRSVKN